jgi:hypothetical protein
MAEERIEETEAGYYVRNGDILEWKWKQSVAEDTEADEEKPKKRRAKAEA